MKKQMYVYYDEEGDFLELQAGDYSDGYFKDIGEGISERIDEKTGKVTGIAIMSFKKRTQGHKSVRIPLPTDILLN